MRQCSKPTFEPLGFTLHKLSEFEPYTSSPVDRDDFLEDEPLFATELSAFGSSITVYQFSHTRLANLNRVDIISDQYGCEPSDIAAMERTKPQNRLSPSATKKNFCPDCANLTNFRVTYVTETHGGLDCDKYLATLEAKNKKATAPCEKRQDRRGIHHPSNPTNKNLEEDRLIHKLSTGENVWINNTLPIVVRNNGWLGKQQGWLDDIPTVETQAPIFDCRAVATFAPRAPLTRMFEVQKHRAEIDPKRYCGWLYPATNYERFVRKEDGIEWLIPQHVARSRFFALMAEVKPDHCKHGFKTTIEPCTYCSGTVSPVVVKDYLAEPCQHLSMRSFTFSTGETIKMCPDCSNAFTSTTETLNAFDKQRENVLRKASTRADARMQHTVQRLEEKLEAEGLSKEPSRNPIVSTFSSVKMDNIEHAKEAHAKEAHSNKNDYRASQIRKDVKPNTEASRKCPGCGIVFVPNHKSRKYCSDNCKKRHFKQRQRRKHGDSSV
jgi:hypothetical protein